VSEFSKNTINKELEYVEINYDFSEDCSIELRNFLLKHSLVSYYDDVLMLTSTGEMEIGADKEDLRLDNEFNQGEDYDF
jgi:beta-glucanase (GH16 family)